MAPPNDIENREINWKRAQFLISGNLILLQCCHF